MTAFYMFRLMSMTFFGAYRGPAWETAGHGPALGIHDRAKDSKVAAVHGAAHPVDIHAHGHGHEPEHEVAHGPAEPHDDDHGGHGHGHWHGPHESPTPMTFPLQALALGAIIAGFVGVPAALGGSNAIEKFLEPSFTAERLEVRGSTGSPRAEGSAARPEPVEARAEEHEAEPHVSRGVEIGLMGFSLLVALIGISVAWKFYVTSPEISDQLAERWAGAHKLLSNKYYVDELYNATAVNGTFGAGDGLWAVDRHVVDGVVNGTGKLTVVSAWFSGLTDRTVVDGVVNLIGSFVQEGSLLFRRVQTGLVQNYALLMLFGIFAFVSLYLLL
jgi:NADH-quinone oxidoreductase subunit L